MNPRIVAVASFVFALIAHVDAAQAPVNARSSDRAPVSSTASAPAATSDVPKNAVFVPADYVVGPEDVLSIVFWRERDMSADAVVRPDGKISLQLLNDIDVAGLTPDQIRLKINEDAKKFFEEPSATVVVKQINSRKVYITGNVERPGTFPLLRNTTVLQLIALAGGLKEFAKASDITVVRNDASGQASFVFNYDEVKNRKNLSQNIVLKPGDTIIVP